MEKARPKSKGRQSWSFEAPPWREEGQARPKRKRGGPGRMQEQKDGEGHAQSKKGRMGRPGPAKKKAFTCFKYFKSVGPPGQGWEQ